MHSDSPQGDRVVAGMKASLRTRALSWLAGKLYGRAFKHPYMHLYHPDGRPYMFRFWLLKIGRSVTQDGEVSPRWLGVRLHIICSSDDDRVPHDHPWPFCTFLLQGGYFEYRPINPSDWGWVQEESVRRYGAGSLIFRHATDWHRLELPPGKETVTLFIHGPRQQDWGFLVRGRKVPWREWLQSNERTSRA